MVGAVPRSASRHRVDGKGSVKRSRGVLAFEVLQPALTGRLVQPSTEQSRVVTEARVRELVRRHFNPPFGPEQLPVRGALGAPSARAAGRSSGEAVAAAKGFEFLRQRRLIDPGEA